MSEKESEGVGGRYIEYKFQLKNTIRRLSIITSIIFADL